MMDSGTALAAARAASPIDATAIRPEGCTTSHQAGIPVVSLPKEVDIANEYLLRNALLDACLGAPVVIVDMTATRHFGAAGVNAVVSISKRMRKAGGELRLVVRSGHIMRMLRVLRIDQHFNIYTNVPEALTMDRRDLLPYHQAA
jgi:anti-sigma B factor antagonist